MEPNLRCSLGSLHQSSSSCGLHPRHPKDTTTVKLSSCNKDIKTHLQNLKLAVGGRCGGLDTHNSEITTEADLLCRSVALFTTNTSLTVCPFYRYTLGLDYRQGKTCLHPDHEGKGKTFRGLSSFQSQRILEEYSLFIPVGSGICYQCHLKLPKQTTSYGEGDTQELSAPISEEDDQFYNFRERHIVKGDHLHENKTVSFIDSQEKTDSEPPSINSSQASSWSIEDNNDIPLENINTALSLLSNGKFSPVKHKIRNDIDSLQPSSRRALKRKATSAVEALLESLAPGQGTELMAMIKGEPATTELTDNSVTDLRKTIIKLK
ncbi:uncharacterized protein [Mytilus edulis]|uniref:uncharacterized protein n=1 Tax=Mytilus edulis TaxID=6550 RepID=UPI0039EF3A49